MDAPANTPPDPGGTKPTYAAIVSPSNQHSTPTPKRGLHKGEPAGFFPPELLGAYSKPFQFAMVGKFSHGRPEMKDIHSFFKAQDFNGQYTVGLLNFRHILVNFHDQKDFHRFYSRMLWYVGDFPMRVFKWTPDFHPERESSLVPVWFKFPNLPIHFFNKDALFFLASLFGTPFRLDSATISLKRPSVARIQIEVDLLKPLPGRLWIGTSESQGFWQRIEPDEDLPLYCSYCWHVGHSEDTCTVNHPELLAGSKCDNAGKQKQPQVETQKKRQEYRRKPGATVTEVHAKPISDLPPEIAVETQKFSANIITANPTFVAVDGVTTLPIDVNSTAVEVNSIATVIPTTDADANHAIISEVYVTPVIEPHVDTECSIVVHPPNHDQQTKDAAASISTTEAEEFGFDPVETEPIPNLAPTPGQVFENSPVATTGDPLQTPQGIYFRPKIPLLRRSGSTSGLIQGNKAGTPCNGSGLNLDNESESEEDYDTEEDYVTEAYEEIIVMDQMGRLGLQRRPVTPEANNQGKTPPPTVLSDSKCVISPVPSAPSPTASPNEDGVLALTSLSAPAVVHMTTDSSSTDILQDEQSFQQPKNRGRKKKGNISQSKLTIVSTASAFAILSEE